ncbi:hypothetical protein LJC27_08325 [Christensenellaceae bacterium OttesenSCG-928-M15]|nr:hypothetical protein [Christensenellaceae bacterium OttesenSCG-928-M15]
MKTRQMNWRLAIAVFLMLCMCCALAACSGGNKVYTQNAKDADLSDAPNVIVEPDKEPYNLGGWKYEDVVAFHFNIGKAGDYKVTLLYSRNDESGGGTEMLLHNSAGEGLMETLPSTGADWSNYKEYTMAETMHFEKGKGTLYLECSSEYSDEYVINLRAVTLTYVEEGAAPASSSAKGSQPTPMKEIEENEQADDLGAYDGWWYMPETYHPDSMHIFEIFRLDAEEQSFTVYNELGSPGSTLPVYLDENGDAVLSLDMLGDVTLRLDGDTLLDEDGDVAFIRGEELSVDNNALMGKWYENGDEEDSYFEFYDDGTFVQYTAYADYTEEGTYTLSKTSRFFSYGDMIEQAVFECEAESMFIGVSLYVTQTGLVAMDTFGDHYYVHESAMYTAEGEQEKARVQLIAKGSWTSDDEPYGLRFEVNDTYVYMELDEEMGSYEETGWGTWTLYDGELTLTHEDGEQVYCEVTDEGIYIEEADITLK